MSFSSFVDSLLVYANDIIVVLISLALVVFLWGLLKYVAAGDNESERGKGRDVIMWGVIGLSVMIGVWGFVNIVANTISGAGGGGAFFNSGSQRNPSLPGGTNFPAGDRGFPTDSGGREQPIDCSNSNDPRCGFGTGV